MKNYLMEIRYNVNVNVNNVNTIFLRCTNNSLTISFVQPTFSSNYPHNIVSICVIK